MEGIRFLKHPQGCHAKKYWTISLIFELLRYISVGALNTLLGYGFIFFLMLGLGIDPLWSNLIGYAGCLICAFFLHRKYSFPYNVRSSESTVRFLFVFIISYILNLIVLKAVLISFVLDPVIAQFFSGIVFVLVSYFMNKMFVFSGRN